jgi:hypothetical protein
MIQSGDRVTVTISYNDLMILVMIKKNILAKQKFGVKIEQTSEKVKN